MPAHPGDAPVPLELRPDDRGIAADVAMDGLIDDEVELRPVLGGLAYVAAVGLLEEFPELRLDRTDLLRDCT